MFLPIGYIDNTHRLTVWQERSKLFLMVSRRHKRVLISFLLTSPRILLRKSMQRSKRRMLSTPKSLIPALEQSLIPILARRKLGHLYQKVEYDAAEKSLPQIVLNNIHMQNIMQQ